MNKNTKLYTLALLAALVAFILYRIDYFSHLNLEFIKSQKENLNLFIASHPQLSKTVFFAAYVTLATLSIPGAIFLTLISPSLFGLVECFILVSTASTIGATLSFLLFRFFLKDWVHAKFKKQIEKNKKQIFENEKPFLLSLRLIPIFPFSWVNMIYSVTNIKLKSFFWITYFGMLPGIIINLYAGSQLSTLNSLQDLYSPKMILTFALMALFPLLLKPFTKKLLR